MNQENPWMTVYHVTSKEDFSFLHQIATTQDYDNHKLLNFEVIGPMMREYAAFWSFFTKSVNTDIYAKVFRDIDPYFQIYVNQYQEILVCKKTENIKREIDYSVYDQNFHEIDNGTYEIDPDYEDGTVESLCSYIDFEQTDARNYRHLMLKYYLLYMHLSKYHNFQEADYWLLFLSFFLSFIFKV